MQAKGYYYNLYMNQFIDEQQQSLLRLEKLKGKWLRERFRCAAPSCPLVQPLRSVNVLQHVAIHESAGVSPNMSTMFCVC